MIHHIVDQKKTALILVDLQNDFCHGGTLAVNDADAIIPLANQLQKKFDHVIATQDWHPKDHLSFASQHPGCLLGDVIQLDALPQILWPNHCVQHSRGAELHPLLDTSHIEYIVRKGTNKYFDSYSAFFDNAHLHPTLLAGYLQKKNISRLYIMGLATDYCVKYSCLDAIQLGFEVYCIQDACRGVELNSGDIDRAIAEMKAVGIKFIFSSAV